MKKFPFPRAPNPLKLLKHWKNAHTGILTYSCIIGAVCNIVRCEQMSNIYVFDLDGTLVDSMSRFKNGVLKILDEEGIAYGDDIIEILTPLGYQKTAEYYRNVLGVRGSVEEIMCRIEETLIEEYSTNIFPKAGVVQYLHTLHEKGARLFVLTASSHSTTDVCLQNNGLFDLFERVWSVDDFGLSKSDTRLFFEVAESIGCSPADIHYFDDNETALKSAKTAGYKTYAIYDAHPAAAVEQMKQRYDVFLKSFEELL